MKLKELKDKDYPRIYILEVLDSVCDIKWTSGNNNEFGVFEIDDNTYTVFYDHHFMKLANKEIDIVEVGFGWGKDSTALLSNLNKNASKVLGCVYNALLPKIKQDDPDYIVLIVQDRYGSVEKRKSLYSHILKLYQRSAEHYLYYKPFFRIGNSEYSYINKELELSDEDKVEFLKQLEELGKRKIERGM